jgi:hypothetical protein
MIAGSASGVATQMTANALTGQPLHEGVFRAAVMGAASGGLFAGVGYGVGRVLKKLPAVGGADFYVTPKGEAIPGKFYRYWFRRPDTLAQAKAGQLAAKEGGTYVSFDAIDDAIIAKGKLQIPYRPEYRVTGDTYSVLDRISIPRGKWGRADYLEPLAKDFPEFGPGRATQAIVEGPVPVDPDTIFKLW